MSQKRDIEMKTMGVQIEERQLQRLKVYGVEDRRSLAFLIRDAIDQYLSKRDAERKPKPQTPDEGGG